MKVVTVRKEAESDINEAFQWYESKHPGLGETFIQYVEDTLSRIAFNPLIYPSIYKDIRRSLTRKFPFGVFYVIENDEIIVTAVMHVRKEPKQWQNRT